MFNLTKRLKTDVLKCEGVDVKVVSWKRTYENILTKMASTNKQVNLFLVC